jgi:hypothetical protein
MSMLPNEPIQVLTHCTRGNAPLSFPGLPAPCCFAGNGQYFMLHTKQAYPSLSRLRPPKPFPLHVSVGAMSRGCAAESEDVHPRSPKAINLGLLNSPPPISLQVRRAPSSGMATFGRRTTFKLVLNHLWQAKLVPIRPNEFPMSHHVGQEHFISLLSRSVFEGSWLHGRIAYGPYHLSGRASFVSSSGTS